MTRQMPPEPKSKRQKWRWKHTRTGRVADALRAQITSGKLASNQKLPTFDELAETYSVSRFTIQNAVNVLKSEGFLHGVQRTGLFVTGNPPHLHRFGLVFHTSPDRPDWPRFDSLVQNSAPGIFKEFPSLSYRSYFNVNPELGTSEWKTLERDISHNRLAAVITLLDAPLSIFFDQLNPAKPLRRYSLFISHHATQHLKSGITINAAFDLFVEKALLRFRETSHRRLAWMTIPPVRYSLEYFRSQGFEIKPHWILHLSRTPADLSYNVTSLMMDRPREQRPDALMIADENLVPGALKALTDLGLQPGKDLEVVAHMNWPAMFKELDPRVHWLGYDVERILSLTIQLFLDGRNDMHHQVIPRFREELQGGSSSQ